MSFEVTAQRAIYAALNGNISAGVYDDVPFLPEGQPIADFPYVTIGEARARPWDTDDTVGQSIQIMLHVWSRAAGMREVKTVMGAIYDILNRAVLTASGYNFVDCLFVNSATMLAGDARTRHGVIEFRLTMQQIS